MNEFEKYFDSKYSGYTECNKNMLRGVAIDAFLAGAAAMRERCAEVAENHHVSTTDLTGYKWEEWGYNTDIAAAIRGMI